MSAVMVTGAPRRAQHAGNGTQVARMTGKWRMRTRGTVGMHQ